MLCMYFSNYLNLIENKKKTAGRKRHFVLKMRQKLFLRIFLLPDHLMLTFCLVNFRSILVIDF